MKKNTIYTNEEYLAQGFTREELPLIRRHDEMFNRYDELTEEEKEELYELIDRLGL